MKLRLAALVLAGLHSGSVAGSDSGIAREAQDVMNHFSKTALRAHMRYLADDLLEGRGTGTRGQLLAAKYVAEEFEAAGLEPAGTAGTYFQTVPFREITVDPARSEVSISRGGEKAALHWGEDFAMGGDPLSPDSSVEAPVVFVGFGVVNRGRGHDDYGAVDVKGKIVAMFPGAPSTFPAEERAHFASTREKTREAVARGAVGILVLQTADSERALPWARTVIGVGLPSVRWLDANGVPNDSFQEMRGRVLLSSAAAERLFAGAPKAWDQVLKDAAAAKPQSFALPLTARIHSVSRHASITSPNVVGVLRGSDPELSKEYVVYTAHTDHLGIGTPIHGDSIYNGAVDNASGVTALIEMARAFAALPKPPARSLMFLGVTAEEKGLLGSDYFAQFPTVPQKSLVADVNMDGASVFYTFKDVVALGAEHTTLAEVVARDAAKLGLLVSPDPMPEQVNFIRSDHYSFVRQGVPSVNLSEGLQAKDPRVDGRKFVENWIETRYHAPSDDMDQPLDFDAMVQFMQIAFLVGYDVAQERAKPVWKSGDFFGNLYGRR